jgi:hypothetical protein
VEAGLDLVRVSQIEIVSVDLEYASHTVHGEEIVHVPGWHDR